MQSKAVSPYKVYKRSKHTVTILRDNLLEVVSRDRISTALSPHNGEEDEDDEPPPQDEDVAELAHRTPDFEDENTPCKAEVAEFPVDKIISYDKKNYDFPVKWTGYEKPMPEPPAHLP